MLRGFDGQSFEEEMSELGVEIVKNKKEIINVTWVNQKIANSRAVPSDQVSFNKNSLIFGDKVIKWLKSERVMVGVGEMDKSKVLLLKPTNSGGSKIQPPGKGSAKINTKTAITGLHKSGLKIGYYEIMKAKDTFVGILKEPAK